MERTADNSQSPLPLASQTGPPKLSPREGEILARLARGSTEKEVARELGIAVGTVARHCHDICAKLGVGSVTEAACLAVSLGLVPPPPAARTRGRGGRGGRAS
jgi:DNA-binding NarL/FixJ family response regulator